MNLQNEHGQGEVGVLRSNLQATARAAMVNRTHRIVRERAKTIQARRNKVRSLWIPLGVSAGLLVAVVFALWSVLVEYDVTPTGLPDASNQMSVLMLWCLPLSVAILAVVGFRKAGTRNDGQADNGGAR